MFKLRSGQELFDDLEQVATRNWFYEPSGSAEASSLVALGGLAFGGQRQNGKESATGQCAHFSDHFKAAHHWHIDVGKNERGLESAFQLIERLLAVAGGFNLITAQGQGTLEAHQHGD